VDVILPKSMTLERQLSKMLAAGDQLLTTLPITRQQVLLKGESGRHVHVYLTKSKGKFN
jgi:hypothetical protein